MAQFKKRDKESVPATIKLTDRAHYDLQEIEAYSFPRWGRKTADRYLEDFQTARSLLQENPSLIRHKSDISPHFKFFRVREHFLVCTTMKNVLLVLTIKHGQLDLPHRIGDLDPTRLHEASLLYARLAATEKQRRKLPTKR